MTGWLWGLTLRTLTGLGRCRMFWCWIRPFLTQITVRTRRSSACTGIPPFRVKLIQGGYFFSRTVFTMFTNGGLPKIVPVHIHSHKFLHWCEVSTCTDTNTLYRCSGCPSDPRYSCPSFFNDRASDTFFFVSALFGYISVCYCFSRCDGCGNDRKEETGVDQIYWTTHRFLHLLWPHSCQGMQNWVLKAHAVDSC